MRVLLTRAALCAAAAAGLVASAARPVSAQSFKPTEYREFALDEKAYHGKKVRMHARLLSKRPDVRTKAWDRRFFNNAGITSRKYYRFTVWFHGQEREGLFPIISRRGSGTKLWEKLKKIKKDDKLTLWGRIKRMGDGGTGSFYGVGLVPSLIHVTRLESGWVKRFDQYMKDLEDPKQVSETLAMLVRGGKSMLGKLQSAAESKRLPDRVRCYALRAIGEIGEVRHAAKLIAQMKKEKTPRVRVAVLVALSRLDKEGALEHLSKLMADAKSDAWAATAAIGLCLAGNATPTHVEEASGKRWKVYKPKLVAAAVAMGEQAVKEDRLERAESCFGLAIKLRPTRAESYLARGRVRLAMAKRKPDDPALPKLASNDISRAIELGVDDPALLLMHADELYRGGDKSQALEFLRRVLKKQPDNPAAKKLQAKILGTSLAMVDARLAHMNRVSIKVPKHWKDAPKDCTRGRVLSVYGLGPKSSEKQPTSWVQIISTRLRALPHKVDAQGKFRLPQPEPALRRWCADAGHRVLESAEFRYLTDTRAAWVQTSGTLSGVSMRYLFGLFWDKDHVYEIWYRCPATQWDDLKQTFMESLRSFRWDRDPVKGR